MPNFPVQVLSPQSDREKLGLPPNGGSSKSSKRMLRIHSLLNPMNDSGNFHAAACYPPPPTPSSSPSAASSFPSTPQPDLPTMPSKQKAKKIKKDAPLFNAATAKEPIHYPPYEANENQFGLTTDQKQELQHQHGQFQIYPSGNDIDGLIGDYPRHIPYSSDKKDFLNKTGREAFEVFQYTFSIPEELGKTYVVMWDYQIGLVRITPFFKACKYSKTVPSRAITTNSGLRELSHSITGGALAAQGYWMPYACARAVCLTFCHPIRWALTPVFGPSFVQDCLSPDDPDFGRFKIDPEVVRQATLEADGWRALGGYSRSATPDTADSDRNREPGTIPRSVPATGDKELRPRANKPKFRLDSPFATDSDASNGKHDSPRSAYVDDSPPVSPKSACVPTTGGSLWTSINQLYPVSSNTTQLAEQLPLSSHVPRTSLRHKAEEQDDDEDTDDDYPIRELTSCRGKAAIQLRRQTGRLARGRNRGQVRTEDASGSSSESDDSASPLARKQSVVGTTALSTLPAQSPNVDHGHGSTAPEPERSNGGSARKSTRQYTAEDYEAAHWLLNLSKYPVVFDSPGKEARGRKRKVHD